VITKQKTRESESSLKEMSTFRLPAFIHSQTVADQELTAGNDLRNPIAIINVRRATSPTDPAPTIAAIFLESLLPNNDSIKKPRKGMAGISGRIIDICIKFN
jgi:hypothetical protein